MLMISIAIYSCAAAAFYVWAVKTAPEIPAFEAPAQPQHTCEIIYLPIAHMQQVDVEHRKAA